MIYRRTQYEKTPKTIAVPFVFVLLIGFLTVYRYRKTIFQRGNPIPYIMASMHITDENPYVEVGKDTGVYITHRGEYREFFDFIEETKEVEFADQLGSGYLFTNGEEGIVISSETYLKFFTVWVVPQNTLHTSDSEEIIPSQMTATKNNVTDFLEKLEAPPQIYANDECFNITSLTILTK